MTDFKLADGVLEVFTPDDPVVFTTPGVVAHVVPADRTLVTIKVYGAGGGGGGVGGIVVPDGGNGGGGGVLHIKDVAVTPGETLNVTVGTGGDGGVSGFQTGGGGNGGGGAGRTFVERDIGSVLLAEGGGGGGGGGGSVFLDGLPARGGDGGPGGGASGQAGGVQAGSVATFGGGGGSPTTAGLGGTGELTGSDGAAGVGGDGADGSGAPDGSNAAGGLPGGGDGGSRSGDIPSGGGGAAGVFGGGGGGSGNTVAPLALESGAGGGGMSNVYTGTLVTSAIGGDDSDGTESAGRNDVDYPGGDVGQGGTGSLPSGGFDGIDGAVVLLYGVTTFEPTCNDLVIEDNAPVMVEGIDQIAQQVRNILLIFQGEWFLDLAAGTPWFTRIIGHKFNSGQINITVREAILSVVGVASIQDIVSERGSAPRSANIRVTVLTTQGAEVIVETEVP